MLLAGCGFVPRIPGITPYRIEIQQGNFISQDMVAQLKPGMSKEQVRLALGTPLLTLARITDLDLMHLSAMVGRQLPFFSVIVPFWLVAAQAGWRGMTAVWPACLVSGASFAITQFLVSNFIGPMLVDIISAGVSIAALVVLMKVWRPAEIQAAPQKADALRRP